MQHTFLYISLPLFCTTTTWNFLVTHFMGKKNVVCTHRRFCSACVPVRFSFTAAHFYLAGFSLLTASISHFLTADINCHVVFPTKYVSFVFLSLALALSLLSMSVWTLKLSRRKTRLCCCFFSLNVRVAAQFRAKTLESIRVVTPVDWVILPVV